MQSKTAFCINTAFIVHQNQYLEIDIDIHKERI